MKPNQYTLTEAANLLNRGEISSVELTRVCLDRAKALEPALSAYICFLEDRAFSAAQAADEKRAKGETAPLLGVPLAVKDIFCMNDTVTTAGSKILENFVAPYNSTVTKRLENAGAVIIGKTAMDEFAMGSSGETCAFGITKNPWNTKYVPGGSSSGSAATMASQTVFGSLGTDTGGSIRQPAAHCGLVGLKPTYGRVSRYGIIAFASSLDQAGAFGKSARDVARITTVISGHDPKDATSAKPAVPDFEKALNPKIDGLRIGIPKEYFSEGLDLQIREKVTEALEVMKDLGATLVEIDLPHTRYAVAAYYIIAPAEASSNLARYDGIRFGLRQEGKDLFDTYLQTRAKGFGREVRRRIMIGTFALSAGYYDAYYGKAGQVRALIKKEFADAFKKVDIIAGPTSPDLPFKIGEKIGDPLSMYLSDVLTIPVNLAGLPGLSTPCGLSDSGLPVGLQLIGPSFGEQKILDAAYAFELAADHLKKWPEDLS